jgi:hypothetical protein
MQKKNGGESNVMRAPHLVRYETQQSKITDHVAHHMYLLFECANSQINGPNSLGFIVRL